MGGAEFAAGIVLRHTVFLAIASAIALVIAGIMHWRPKWRRDFQFPMMALVAAPLSLEQALTPPDHWPVIQRGLIGGGEGWVWVLVIMAVLAMLYWGLIRFLKKVKWFQGGNS